MGRGDSLFFQKNLSPFATLNRYISASQIQNEREVVFVERMRAVLTSCLCMLILLSLPVHTYAGTSALPFRDSSMLSWQNVVSISANLSINNSGTATVSGSVIANPGTESITVNAVLERVNPNGTLTNIASWNGLRTNGNTWAWETTRSVVRGHDYRLTLTVTAVRNGVSETVSISRTTRAN